MNGAEAEEAWRIHLQGDGAPSDVLLVPWGSEGRIEAAGGMGGDSSLRVVYYAPADGRLRAVTLFLPGQWAGAEATLDEDTQSLQIIRGQARITVPLHLEE